MKIERDTGCIYRALNMVNGKSYIGKTVQSFEDRINQHSSGQGSKLLRSAIRKYGIDSILWTALEKGLPEEMLDERERYWIDKYDCISPNGYNLTTGGEGASHSGKPHRKTSKPKRKRRRHE